MTASAACDLPRDQRIKLADGRRLAWAEYGDPTGAAVVYCHGLPGSRLEAALAHADARHAGLRLLAPDRPGFGRSSPNPGATVADWPDDLEQLLDTQDLERIALLGVSGGGPFALAAGVRLPARIRALALAASFASLGELERLYPAHRITRLLRLLRRHPRFMRTLLRQLLAPVLAAAPERAIALLCRGSEGEDRAVLGATRVRAGLARSLREALRQRGAGAIAELHMALDGDTVDPGRLRCPATVWHGDADAVVPPELGRRLAARIPGAQLRNVPGAGHCSLPLSNIGGILHELRE